MTPKKILLLLTALMLFSCNNSTKNNTTPKNVILLISDGTGLSQISSAFYFKETPSNYQRFQTIGLIKTSSQEKMLRILLLELLHLQLGKKHTMGLLVLQMILPW
jgi:alkaline phosphatase